MGNANRRLGSDLEVRRLRGGRGFRGSEFIGHPEPGAHIRLGAILTLVRDGSPSSSEIHSRQDRRAGGLNQSGSDSP